MGVVHMNSCRNSVQSRTAPPSTFVNPPYVITTPDANPYVPGPPKNMLNIWLIVQGSVMLFLTIVQIVLMCCFKDDSRLPRLGIIFLHWCWAIAWIIVGGIFLFTSTGKTCKKSVQKDGYRVWQTSLAIWILNLLGLPGFLFLVILTSD